MVLKNYDVISIPSQNVSQGITITPKLIIAHCIGLPLSDVIEGLTLPTPKGLGVSAHYFIPQITGEACVMDFLAAGFIEESPPLAFPNKVPAIQFVDESKRALHAGGSHWGDFNLLPGCTAGLNSCSIGIEFHAPGYGVGGDWFAFKPYTQDQMATGTLLMQDIVNRWSMDPRNILAHSDIAPYSRRDGASPRIKTDPGPLFPWRSLYDEGLGFMPRVGSVDDNVDLESCEMETFVRSSLHDIGYNIPVNDESSLPWGDQEKHIVNAYKMHYMHDSYIPCDPNQEAFGRIDKELILSLRAFKKI